MEGDNMNDLNKLLDLDESIIIDNPSMNDNRPDKNYDPKELEMGIKVELEDNHSDNEEIQKSIAKDHLDEDPKYYTKLKTIDSHY